ncbi:MAG: hypothetical protein ACRBBN_00930 [Methyloligellaceae bacterium]
MDFLILTRSANDWRNQQEVASQAFLNKSFYKLDKKNKVQNISLGNLAIITNSDNIITSDQNSFLFDGYFISNDIYHSRETAPTYNALEHLINNQKNITGCYTTIKLNKKDLNLSLYTDILSQYIVFTYSMNGNIIAFSNNPYILEEYIKKLGEPVFRSLENACLQVSYLSGLSNTSPFDKISLLPARASIHYNNSTHTFYTREELSRENLLNGTKSYAEALELFIHDFQHNCKKIIDQKNKHLITDLSGGVDSRMVLSGLLNEDYHDMHFFNINNNLNNISADRKVAIELAEKFNLKGGVGVTDATTSTATKNSYLSFGTGTKIIYGSGHYMGLLPYAFEDYGELILLNYGRVTGYCGEHSRAPGPNLGMLIKKLNKSWFTKKSTKVKLITNKYMDHCTGLGRNNGAQYLTELGREVAYNQFQSYFDELISDDIDAKLINTMTYLENRSRFHFGIRSVNGNRTRMVYSPLSSPTMLKIHPHMRYGHIFSNRIGHDLMIKLVGKDIAYHAYADFRWSSNILGDYAKDYIENNKIHYSGDGNLREDIFPNPICLREANPTKPECEYTKWLSEGSFADSSATLRDFILEYLDPNHRVWSIFNRTIFSTIDTNVISSQENMNFQRVLSAIVFASGLSNTSKLDRQLNIFN